MEFRFALEIVLAPAWIFRAPTPGWLASDVVDQRLHQRLNLRQFTERVELRELDHKLVGIEWIERALVFELHGQQL